MNSVLLSHARREGLRNGSSRAGITEDMAKACFHGKPGMLLDSGAVHIRT